MALEVAVGIVVAWVLAKTRRAGKQLDDTANEVVDAAAARVRDLVLKKLYGQTVMQRLEQDAIRSGEVTNETRLRLEFALKDAVEDDQSFADELREAVNAISGSTDASAMEGGTAVSGSATASGQGSSSVGVIGSIGGNASFGGGSPDPQSPRQT